MYLLSAVTVPRGAAARPIGPEAIPSNEAPGAPWPHDAQRGQLVHKEGHVPATLHLRLASASDHRSRGARLGRTGYSGEQNTHSGAERSPKAPRELQVGRGSGFPGDTPLYGEKHW